MKAIAADKGLPLDVYKHAGVSYSNGGISEGCDRVTLVAVRGIDSVQAPVPPDCRVFAPSPDAPAVVLVVRRFSFGDHAYIEPLEPGEGTGPMMGGCYVSTSDSRFRQLAGARVALPLHDRFETANGGGE